MDLVTEVRTLLNEATGVWWTDAQVYDGLNAAIIEVWGSLKWKVGTSTYNVSVGNDIVAFSDTDIMIPQFFLYNNLKQFNSNQTQLEDWSRRWKNEPPARPKWFVLWDASHFRVFPSPDASYTFTLWGVPWPTEINAGNTDLTLDAQARKAIVFRAVAHLLELTQPQLADTYMQQSVYNERRQGEQQRTQLGVNTWRLAPGVGWEIAQSGNIRLGRKYQ